MLCFYQIYRKLVKSSFVNIIFIHRFTVRCRLRIWWYTLAQLYTRCEIEFLPVYIPSPEEKKDSHLYAKNVRQVMSQ